MKLKTLALSIALATSLNSYAADPVLETVTVNGVSYLVYVTSPTTFGDILAENLQISPWWGGAEATSDQEQLAVNIAKEYFNLNSDRPNNYDGLSLTPFAAYQAYKVGEDDVAAVGTSYLQLFGNVVWQGLGPIPIDSPFVWLLYFGIAGPSAEDTLASMQPNASAMKNAFNSQYATLAYGLNHDCTIYDTNGVCVSVFGRNTSLNDSSFDSNAGGLVLGYKPHAQFRIGTYIDQSLNSNTTSGVKVERSNPDVGVFGVWNMNADGSGLELRAAANYGKRDLNVARSVVGTAEAGSGKSDLNAYGALLEASFAYAMNDSWTAKPYAGVRYLSIKRDSYAEASTDNVYNPLNYSNLEQETTSAIAGIRFNGRLAPKVIASLNAGLEHDLHYSIDDYRATGVNGLGSIDMNSQKDRTRPTAGLGISYDVAEKQRVAASVQYRKEIFMSESSTTGQINYTIGF